MYLGFILIVALSLLTQVAAAVWALRLMGITRSNKAWMLVAAAMLAMAIRRAAVLAGVLAYPALLDSMDYWSEAIGLLSAVVLLVGFAAIGPLFRTIQRAKEDLQRVRDQLEREVREQTADLRRATRSCKPSSYRGPRSRRPSAMNSGICSMSSRSASATSGCWPTRSTMASCNRPRRP